jgi:hypothetical protein
MLPETGFGGITAICVICSSKALRCGFLGKLKINGKFSGLFKVVSEPSYRFCGAQHHERFFSSSEQPQ